VPNTFNGIAWHPNGREFYVAGGVDDNVHTFDRVEASGVRRAQFPWAHCR
jgi:sugar lactone lactonase YvrE